MSVVANVAINVDSRNAANNLKQLEAQASRTERAFNSITAVAGKLAAALAVFETGRFIIAKTSELESQTKSLEVLTGSVQKATKIIQELQQLGAVTPFTSTELIDAAKRLNAFGVEADKVVETTRRLADVSGATGAELQGLVTAYGQVQAKGRLQGEELLQFQERGVSLQKELQAMYRLSGKELQDALSKGRISAEAVEVAIIRLTNAGGKYANGAIAQSDTLAGKFSTLTDGVEQLARTVGTVLSPVIKGVLSQAIDAVNQINVLLGTGIASSFNRRVQTIAQQLSFGARSDALQGTRSIIAEIDAAPQKKNKAGVQAQLDALNQVDAQLRRIGAQGLPDNVYQDIMRQQTAITGLRKELQGYLADLQKVDKTGGAKDPAIPDLLAGTQKKPKTPRRKSLDELIGGDVKRRLDERQAGLGVDVAQRMGQAQGEQAQRMVQFYEKYRSIANQILAINETEEAIIKNKAVLVANGIKPEEKLRDLAAERKNLSFELLEQMQLQYNASAQAEQERQSAYDKLLGSARYEITLLREKDPLKRALLEIDKTLSSEELKKLNLTEAQLAAYRALLTEAAKLRNETKVTEEIWQDMYGGIAGAFGGAIDAITDKTKTLGESLGNIGVQLMQQIGKMLIIYGIAQALGAVGGKDGKGFFSGLAAAFGYKAAEGAYWPGGFQAFADGGLVTRPTMGLVGEGGEAEYIIPASKMRGAMERYSAGARGSAVIPSSGDTSTSISPDGSSSVGSIDVRYTVERINSVDYVTADQFRTGMRQAAKEGAARGEQQTLRRLQMSASTRKRIGV